MPLTLPSSRGTVVESEYDLRHGGSSVWDVDHGMRVGERADELVLFSRLMDLGEVPVLKESESQVKLKVPHYRALVLITQTRVLY